MAQKFRTIILLHFGLVTLRFHFQKTHKVRFAMLCWLSGRGHDSQNQLCLSLDPPNYRQKWRCNINSNKTVFSKSTNLAHRKCHCSWKRRVPNNPGDPSYIFFKILNMGSISFKKHEMDILNILKASPIEPSVALPAPLYDCPSRFQLHIFKSARNSTVGTTPNRYFREYVAFIFAVFLTRAW